jgi:hypothetical protein
MPEAFPAQEGGMIEMGKFFRGDRVIYEEETRNPGGTGSEAGGDSADIVQHFMTVRESSKKGTVVLVTQTGKMHVTLNTNPNLRRARWWERLLYRDRFPRLNLGER